MGCCCIRKQKKAVPTQNSDGRGANPMYGMCEQMRLEDEFDSKCLKAMPEGGDMPVMKITPEVFIAFVLEMYTNQVSHIVSIADLMNLSEFISMPC